MSLLSTATIREATAVIVELGLVDPETPARNLPPEWFDETLDYFGDSTETALPSLLDELGIRYTLDYKTFRGINEAEEGREGWYREELERIAACTRGLITITQVKLVEDEEDSKLTFLCNGRPDHWPVDPGEDEAFEASLTFASYISDLTPDDSPERWCSIDPPDPDYSAEAVFADPQALRQLGERFGVTFTE
ncbi:hypothetical protein [Nocardia sp. NPDC051463]|uniref:hypothetical protein n=1 Tax=Nocardia sp. NPDC051463 TaxID=3154845 RepID=UPI003450EA76